LFFDNVRQIRRAFTRGTPQFVARHLDEIAEQTYRLSVFVPQAADGAGFTFNHFLIVGDEPLLFHCGFRKMFTLVSAAVGKIMPVDRLRRLSLGHFEADEWGSMNEWLAAAPGERSHGDVGTTISSRRSSSRRNSHAPVRAGSVPA